VVPYLAVMLQDRGAEGGEIGLALLLFPVASLAAGPAWAAMADRRGRADGVLRAAAALAAVALAALLLAPDWRWMALGLMLFAAGRAPQVPLVDVLTVKTLGPARESYGRIRVWGSVVFLVVAPAAGWLQEVWAPAPLALGLGLACATALVTFSLPPAPSAPAPALLPALRQLARHPLLTPLMLAATLHGVTLGVYNLLFSLHVIDVGFGGRVIGAALAAGVIVEIGVMAKAKWLMTRFGPGALLMVGVIAGIPRWWFTASATSAEALIALQGLHGLTFGAWWVASVAIFTEHAPPAIRNATQALLPATSHGVGTLIAAALGALLLDSMGTGGLMRGMAGLSLVASALTGLALTRGKLAA
jgi:PPP family 3-phenylpropionic acid transporter